MIFTKTSVANPPLSVRYILCLISLLLSAAAVASPTKHLNGVGSYYHMGKDYYLVAHYTSQSCEAAITCEEATTPSRFLLKIITPRWTSHSYSLVWQRELSSNNSQTLDNENLEALLGFTRIAETPLTQGDTIDLVFDGNQTTIAVNKVFAIRAPGKALFNYIGRAWLGPVPPSREFQQSMLAGHQGHHDPATLARFKAIKPNPNRMSLLDTWHAKKEVPVPVITPKIQPKREAPKKVAAKTAPTKPKTVKPAAPTEKPEIPREQQLATLEWHIHNTLFQQVKYPSWAKQFGQEGSVSITFTLNNTLGLVSIDNIEPPNAGLLGEAVSNALERSQPFTVPAGITAKIETLKSTYQHNFSLSQAAQAPAKPSGVSIATFDELLTGETRRNIAPENINTDALRTHLSQYVDYPYWAKSLRLKGTVKALITLNAQGQLEDVTIMKGSRHAGFNQAIKEAAKKATPYPVTPQSPDSDTLISFDYHHVFTP